MNTNAQRMYVIGDWGLYRSDDGGTTWHQLAADDQRIRNGQGGYNCGVYVDPQNPDVVYVCGLGREWGPNEERGVFKTVDGGKAWKKVLYVDPQTACSDIADR